MLFWIEKSSADTRFDFPLLARNYCKMLYLVGLGLGDPKDITVRGLEIVKAADEVYLEAYTSILTVGKEALVSLS
jgi:hypothetical protein